MSELVFAYGSNMCSGRFRDYGVSPTDARAARLHGYRLVFNKPSADGSGKGNVEPHSDSDVYGVIYTITEAELTKLDAGEGKGYYRVSLPVLMSDGTGTTVWVYLASETTADPNLRPYTWYKHFLAAGAREHLLPPDYIAYLERIEANQDDDAHRDLQKRALVRPP